MSIKQSNKTLRQTGLSDFCAKFIDAGIACNALCVLDKLGICNDLLNKGFIEKSEISEAVYPRPHLVKAAIRTICSSGLLHEKPNMYFLTGFGKELIENIGFINLLYGSYSQLLASQERIAVGEISDATYLIDFDIMGAASDQIAGPKEDAQLLKILSNLNIQGRVCDLGCGSGRRLINICNHLNTKGLGIDQCRHTIDRALDTQTDTQVHFEVGNVVSLSETYRDVKLVMQCFMTHDIAPQQQLSKMLKRYTKAFPQADYFLVLDVVATNSCHETPAPGFDYIHGLQGFEVHCKEQLLNVFSNTGFEIISEHKFERVPSSYIWIFKFPDRGRIDE